jgi:putative ABC transport system ATP-binding protein
VIQAQRLVKSYALGPAAVHALRGVSFSIEAGDFVAIMGASGSGKSTLMNIVGCLDLPTRGRYLLDGIDVRLLDDYQLAHVRNQKIGFVFQSFNLIPRTTALQNVELPLAYAGIGRKQRRARAVEALRTVGLGNRMHHLPTELSGGQQQRAAVARAIVSDPAIILADEPTGNLDSESSREIVQMLCRLSAAGRTVVLITHETEIAQSAKRVLRLRDGAVVEDRRQAPLEALPPGFVPGDVTRIRAHA